jgi:hypothetical protein
MLLWAGSKCNRVVAAIQVSVAATRESAALWTAGRECGALTRRRYRRFLGLLSKKARLNAKCIAPESGAVLGRRLQAKVGCPESGRAAVVQI